MLRLYELQRAFAEAIVEGKYQAVMAAMAADRIALRGVACYRRMIRTNYTQVLKITYPVFARFVGEHTFEILARAYLRRYSSFSGDLFHYGRQFPQFLDELEATAVPTSLARLDWTCHEVHQAHDSPTLAPHRLQTLADADPAHVVVQISAAARIVRCPFSVYRIWQALQPDSSGDDEIDLPLNEETVTLVTRREGRVQIARLNPLDGHLVEAMAAGATLGEIEQMATSSQPEFDFKRFWTTLLTMDMLTDCSVEESL